MTTGCGFHDLRLALTFEDHWLSSRCDTRELSFRIGSTESKDGGQIFTVDHFTIHENYTGKWDNDVAVVKLNKPITFGKNAKAIKLGTESLKLGTKGMIAGWGGRSEFDWGDPLMYKGALYGQLIGINDCLSSPVVYTDIPAYADWIKSAIQE
ncbi:trypsin epsilon-like [Homalodisca vitripennis]|uniref:trypsin epsilon-like n=1 Tax=Homalodisca vitripennis TaxID=197043 RepID=UPI001EEC7A96|nr:trypsin epsilon-like [Homalodisca vitripennis]